MKNIIIIIFFMTLSSYVTGQKYFTKNGNISFESNAPMEKITADNKKATCVIDFENGAMEWAVLINAFRFEKALMEEHFNENYMESTKFPKAIFKGQIENINSVDLSKDGSYQIKVSGILDIRGKKNQISTDATIEVKDGKLSGQSAFSILVADYDIEIPKLVRENIAKEVFITINANYLPL